MRYKRALRYLAPNLLTGMNFVFGMLSLVAAHEGRHVDAGWLIIYAVLTDRLDGFVARLVRGTSELGVQLDSFADFLNFGVAPAVLVYTAVGTKVEVFHGGTARVMLMLACCAWILAAVFRLARYNITTEDDPDKIFFGVPTTLIAGVFVIWFLALVKYSAEGAAMYDGSFGGMKLFGDIHTPDRIWHFVPVVMFVGAFLMASNLRMPKLGLTSSRFATIFVFTNVFFGYVCGFARVFPEYMMWPPTAWVVLFLAWGALSPAARAMKPAPLFPPVDPAPGKEPRRPEDDLLPEGTDTSLDGAPPASPPASPPESPAESPASDLTEEKA